MLKRPICLAAVFFMLGIILKLYLSISVAFLVMLEIGLGAIFFICSKKVKIAIYALILLMGTLFITRVDAKYESIYSKIAQIGECRIKAVVISDAVEEEYKHVYEVEVRQVDGSLKNQKEKWLLNVKKGSKIPIKYGSIIEFSGSFEIPSTARNYMGFDYQKYLKTQKVYGNINVKGPINVISEENIKGTRRIIYQVKENIKNQMEGLLSEECSSICIGILIGNKDTISEETKNSFKASNLTHMLAVSGSHISYVILGASILFSKIHKRASKVFIILFLIFFMGITNFTPSVGRAGIMASLMIVSSLFYRKFDTYIGLGISAIFILFGNPYAILDIGFQLSYGGTLGIVILYPKILIWCKKQFHLKQPERSDKWNIKICRYIMNIVLITISANIVLIPMIAFHFHTISIIFLFSNMLASPLLGIIIILGFLTYFVSIVCMNVAMILAIPLKYSLVLLMTIATFFSKIPFSQVIIKTPYLFEILIYYYFIYIVTFHITILKHYFQYIKERKLLRSLLKKLGIGIIFIIVLIYLIRIPINENLKIYFIDVGQGDCMLIKTPKGKSILVDGGGSENSSFDVGEKTLLPYLLDRKITKIDYMLISHFDSDHIGRIIYHYGETKNR